MKAKTRYCTLTFYLKNDKIITDTAARIVKFDEEKIIVESRFFYIYKELIKSVSVSMIECANMQISINSSVINVERNDNIIRYTLIQKLKKDINLNGLKFSTYNQSAIKKLNIQKMNYEVE